MSGNPQSIFSPASAGEKLRKLLPTINLVTSPTKQRTKELTAATASMISSMTSSTFSMATQAGTVLKDQTISAVSKVTQDLSSLVVNSGQILNIDAFQEYLGAVDPIYDEFLKKQPVLKAPDKASIPAEYFNSDYAQSGLLQHDILRQPLRRTVTYSDRTLEELTVFSDTIEALLLNHLEHFDQLLQGLESLNLLEQGLYTAIAKIQQTRAKVGNFLHFSPQLRLYQLARRKARIQKLLVFLQMIENLKQGEYEVKVAIDESRFLDAVTALRNLESAVSELPAIPAIKGFLDQVQTQWTTLDKFLENDLVESIGRFLISTDVSGNPAHQESRLSEKTQKVLSVVADRGHLAGIFASSLKEIVNRRAKTRLRKVMAFAVTGKPGSSDEDVQVKLASLSAVEFSTVIASIHDLTLNDVMQRLTCFVTGAAAHVGAATDPLFRLILETTAVLDGRVAGLISGVRLDEDDLYKVANALEGRVHSVFAQTVVLARTLKQPHPPLIADNVTSELQKKARTLFDEKLNLGVSELTSTLSKEKWEPFKTAGGAGSSGLKDFLRDMSGRATQDEEEDDGARKTVKIGRSVFVPVPSLFSILNVVKDAIDFWMKFRLIGPDVLIRLDATIGKYNEQVRDLVLGGGAVRQGVRQSVTATNLSMAAQSCGAVAALLPLVSNAVLKHTAENPGFFSKVAGQSKLEAALEDLKFGTVEELLSHKNDILSKIAAILIERFEQLNCLVLSGEENTGKLCRDFNSMYKVLLKCQSPAETKNIFKSAFSVMTAKFAEKLKAACRTRDLQKLADLNLRVSSDLAAFYANLATDGDLTIAGVADVLADSTKRMLETLDALLPATKGEDVGRRTQLRDSLNSHL